MGYGLGIFLLVLGLIFVLDVITIPIPFLDTGMLGWILVLAGVLVIVLTAVQLNARRRTTSTSTIDHHDGTQTTERRTTHHDDPPPAV